MLLFSNVSYCPQLIDYRLKIISLQRWFLSYVKTFILRIIIFNRLNRACVPTRFSQYCFPSGRNVTRPCVLTWSSSSSRDKKSTTHARARYVFERGARLRVMRLTSGVKQQYSCCTRTVCFISKKQSVSTSYT